MTKEKTITREERMFRHDPIWKTLIKLAIPSMIMMLVFGSYFFFDNVLSINFAGDAYTSAKYNISGIDGPALVRIFMNGYSPINSLMVATALLFGVGIATRSAINMGKGDKERAKKTIRTGFMIGIIASIILTPILIVSAKPWIGSQYSSFDSHSKSIITDNAFMYAWPVIISFPLMMFNNIIPSLLRNEARMKQMMVAMISPIFLNLFLDWVFMGPVGMGVEGGAWATFTANALTTAILSFWITKSDKTSLVRWKILISWRFKLIAIIGILLIGIAPFFRNMSQSITSSVQTNIINEVSGNVFKDDYINHWDSLTKIQQEHMLAFKDPTTGEYSGILKTIHYKMTHSGNPNAWKDFIGLFNMKISDKFDYGTLATRVIANIKGPLSTWKPTITNKPEIAAFGLIMGVIDQQATSGMISIVSGAMPVYILFFPIMFAFVQAAGPLASFNYGAKQYNRVRKVYWWTMLYAAVAATIIYFFVAWGISGPLISLLKVENSGVIKSKDISISTLKIIMLAMITFVLGIAGMVIFSSTDRVISSIITSSLQGLILIWVVIFPFKTLAINNVDNNLLFFWYIPVLSGLTSLIVTIMVIRTLITINRKHQVTLDERVDNFYELQIFYRNRSQALKKARINNNVKETKNLWKEKRFDRKQSNKIKHKRLQKEVEEKYSRYKAEKIALKNK